MKDKKAILTLREPLDRLIAVSDLPMYRTRSQRIRTFSILEMKAKILCPENVAIYQILSPKIKELKTLGLLNEEIAIRLGIHKKTVKKGLAWQD